MTKLLLAGTVKTAFVFATLLAVFAGIKALSAQTSSGPLVLRVPEVKQVAPKPLVPAVLGVNTRTILPPAEYDHDYEGDLEIRIVNTIEELLAACGGPAKSNPTLLGCSFFNYHSCVIIMVRDEVMRKRNYTIGIMFRHERGHCNGWGSDHAGMRAPAPGYLELPASRVRTP